MRLTLKELAKRNGYEDVTKFLLERGNDSVVPACCEEECEVEPDGRCKHGYPSILLAAGMI